MISLKSIKERADDGGGVLLLAVAHADVSHATAAIRLAQFAHGKALEVK